MWNFLGNNLAFPPNKAFNVVMLTIDSAANPCSKVIFHFAPIIFVCLLVNYDALW